MKRMYIIIYMYVCICMCIYIYIHMAPHIYINKCMYGQGHMPHKRVLYLNQGVTTLDAYAHSLYSICLHHMTGNDSPMHQRAGALAFV